MPENTTNTAAETAAQETNQTAQTTDAAQQAQPERTFTQADVERIIADRLSRERRQHQQDIENARTEGERLAQMTREQRAEEEAQRREQQLQQREAEITRRELRAQAVETLGARNLPAGLANMLDYSSADACNTSIENVERVFREAVQAAVDDRLKSSGTPLPAPGSKPDYAKMSDADYYAATYNKK